jgi:hypothetical protein
LRATEQALNTLPVDGLSTLCQLLTSDTWRRLRRTFLFGNEICFYVPYFFSFFVCRLGNEAVPLVVLLFYLFVCGCLWGMWRLTCLIFIYYSTRATSCRPLFFV